MERSKARRQSVAPGVSLRLLDATYLLLLATYLSEGIFSADIFLHLVSGRWIAAYGEIPTQNYWTTAGLGRAWYPAAPAFDFTVNTMETWAGERGIAVMKLFTLLLFVTLSADLFTRLARDRFVGVFLTSFTSAGAFVTYSFDAQSFGWLSNILLLWAAVVIASGLHLRQLLIASAAIVLAANLHRAFPLLSLTALPLLRLSPVETRGRSFVAFGLLSAAAIFLRPQPLHACAWVVQEYRRITEFLLPTGIDFISVRDYTASFLLLLWLTTITLAPGRAISFALFLPALVTSLGGVMIRSWLPYGLILTATVCAFLSSNIGEERIGVARALAQLREQVRAALNHTPAGWLWVLGCLTFLNLLQFIRTPIYWAAFPRHEVDRLLELEDPFPVLSSLAEGGYLVHRFTNARGEPRHLAAADGRLPAIDPFLARSALGISNGQFDPQLFLTVVKPRSAVLRATDHFAQVVRGDRTWELIPEPSPNPEQQTQAGTSHLTWEVYRRIRAHPVP